MRVSVRDHYLKGRGPFIGTPNTNSMIMRTQRGLGRVSPEW